MAMSTTTKVLGGVALAGVAYYLYVRSQPGMIPFWSSTPITPAPKPSVQGAGGPLQNIVGVGPGALPPAAQIQQGYGGGMPAASSAWVQQRYNKHAFARGQGR